MSDVKVPVGIMSKSGHPLLRVLVAAPTNYPGKVAPRHDIFIAVAASILGWQALRGLPGYNAAKRPSGLSAMRAWIEQTPLVRAWLHSDTFLRAPAEWPDLVRTEFGWACPSPYEVSMFIGRPKQRAHRPADCILYAYCAGLDVSQLSAILGKAPSEVVWLMANGVRELLEDPRFVLWCWNLDWSKVIIPPEVDDSILTRLDIKNTLLRGEQFHIEPGAPKFRRLKLIVNSPRMERYAMVAPKRPFRSVPPRWLENGIIRAA